MALPYILLLILAGLIGIHCEITVSKLSVKASSSITIPCLYEKSYRNHVKYLCKGYYFNFCKIVVRTDKPTNGSERFSISDDTNQNIFTVSINDLTDKDTHYWCAVEIKDMEDVRQYFQLSVITGLPILYVDKQEIIAFEGGSVTIGCHYKYPTVPKWCRLGSTCVGDESGFIETTPETNNTDNPILNMKMRAMKPEASGWYLCAQDDLQMPVHITVKKLTSNPTITMSNNTARRPGGGSLQENHMSSTQFYPVLITILAIVLMVITAAFFGWRMRRCNTMNSEESDTTVGTASDVLYTTIVHDQCAAAHKKQDQYSTIVIKDNMQLMNEPTDISVIYSTPQRKI